MKRKKKDSPGAHKNSLQKAMSRAFHKHEEDRREKKRKRASARFQQEAEERGQTVSEEIVMKPESAEDVEVVEGRSTNENENEKSSSSEEAASPT